MSSAKPLYFCPGSPDGLHDMDTSCLTGEGRDDGAFPSGVWYRVRCKACGRSGWILIRDHEYEWDAPGGGPINGPL